MIDDGHFSRQPAAIDDGRFEGQSFRFDIPFHRVSGVASIRPRAEAPSQTVALLVDRLNGLEAELASANAVWDLHPEPMLVIDRAGAVIRANPAARMLFGDCAARRLPQILDKPIGQTVAQAVECVLAGGAGAVVDFAFRPQGHPQAGGFDRHLRARIERLPGYGGADPSVLIAVTDLTEVKRAEQLRADFVANASHELRTPLAILLGFIETLTGAAADDAEAQQRFLPIMQQQAARMARLVDDLLSLSRIELTEHAVPTDRVDIAEIVGPVARALTLRAAEHGMRIELAVAGGLPPVLGEADELAQVFQNLIDNAIKYARPDTAITVSVGLSSKIAGGVAVRVRDRGEGIAKRHLPRLTERFYRADRDRSRAVSGTGLGLAIVKHVVNRHQGLLAIESKVGKGSVFSVHLAAAPCRAVAQVPSAERLKDVA